VRMVRMNQTPAPTVISLASWRFGGYILFLFLSFAGCNSWTGRMFMLSMDRMTDPVKPAPHMITTPRLENVDLAVGWVGHATTLVQIKDKLFMTDPLLNHSVGIVVKRWFEPGLDPSILSELDFTLISHTHFDHLNLGSLDELPTNGSLVVPVGALQFIPEYGFKNLYELGAWESFEEDGVKITAVPVLHFGGRYGVDRGWSDGIGYTGYVIEYEGITVYFGGDTGYDGRFFKEVGERFSIDLAIIPIGPGDSNRTGGRIHVEPGGAFQIFDDLKARYFLPIHHGTVPYTSDGPPTSSITTLRDLARQRDLTDRVIDLEIGQQRVIIPAGMISNPQGISGQGQF
jgi:N-acyl-phosphatidylethanolamine-hydrolysing phospholipase D